MAAKSVTMAAVDLGAGSGRVMEGTLSEGTLSLREAHRFVSPPRQEGDYLRWDLPGLEASIREGLARIEAPLASVGIDTWGVDFVLTGTDGQPLEPARCYRNEHTRPFVDEVLGRLGPEAVYRSTGIQTMHFNTLFQLAAWKAADPDGLDRARRFAMVPDWLIHRLGAPLGCEVTNASTTQLLDARTRDWNRGFLSSLGLEADLFPTPSAPGTLLAPSAALGAHRPALIAPATHDTGSAVAAIPLRDDRSAYIATGTWCLIGIESKTPETGEASRAANFTNEAGVDGTYRYLRNCMGLWLVQQLKASWDGCPDFGPLTGLAAAAEPFAALVDADDPSFFQPASMKRALEEFWARTGQKAPAGVGGYARCCLDSLVLAFRKTLREIETLRGLKLDRVHLVGGGCRNELLCQLTADATGLPVFAGPVEGSALGNLIVQARTLGLVGSLAEARRLVERSFPLVEYRPRADRSAWDEAEKRLIRS